MRIQKPRVDWRDLKRYLQAAEKHWRWTRGVRGEVAHYRRLHWILTRPTLRRIGRTRLIKALRQEASMRDLSQAAARRNDRLIQQLETT